MIIIILYILGSILAFGRLNAQFKEDFSDLPLGALVCSITSWIGFLLEIGWYTTNTKFFDFKINLHE